MVMKSAKKIVTSIDFWKIAIPVTVPLLAAVFAWYMAETGKLQWEQYKRKEESYKQLLVSSPGFYVSTFDAKLRDTFLKQLNICWLYAPDEVIQKAYEFLDTVSIGVKKSSEEKKLAYGAFVVAIRKDLLSRDIVDSTDLKPSDFKHLKPIGK